MARKTNDVVKSIKDMNWSHIQLTQKGFRGAILTYKSLDDKLVPVLFYLHEAYVVEDNQGLFGVKDLIHGLVKQKNINLSATTRIKGASILSWEEEGQIFFNTDNLKRLGINSGLIREDMSKRLLSLSRLDELEEIPL